MGLFDGIVSGIQPAPLGIVIYGEPGIGKSTFAAGAPAPFALDLENGMNQIGITRHATKSFTQVLQKLDELLAEDHPFQTVILDSATKLEPLLWDSVCTHYAKPNLEEVGGGYSKGYIFALTWWDMVIRKLNDLRRQKGMHWIVVGHAEPVKSGNPELPEHRQNNLRLHPKAAYRWIECADAVLYAHRKTVTSSDPGNKDRRIAKQVGDDEAARVLRCVGSPGAVAKNRLRLPHELRLNWKAFEEAVVAGYAAMEADQHGNQTAASIPDHDDLAPAHVTGNAPETATPAS